MTGLVPRLEAAIRELRQGDSLRRVHVVVASHLLGAWLGPRLFADTGHLGVDFVLLPELAWRIAAPRVLAEGHTRVPENVDLALLLAEVGEAAQAEGTPDYLREAASLAGFAPAALRTLQDLGATGVSPEALESAAAGSADPERLRLLARLQRGLQRRLDGARLLDRASLYREAAKALPARELGAVVLCGLDDVAPAAAGLLAAVKAHHAVVVVEDARPTAVAPRHDARTRALAERLAPRQKAPRGQLSLLEPGPGDTPPAGPVTPEEPPAPAIPATSLARLQESLFDRSRRAAAPLEPGDAPATARSGSGGGDVGQGPRLDDTVAVLAAAGESLEAVEVARLVQRATAQGLTYADVAVLLHDPSTYAAPLSAAFARAGIEAFFVDGEPRIDPAARGLWLLLGLVGGDLDRRAVMELLTTARIRWGALLGEGAEISPAQWDRLSAEAGIVSGREAWRTQLAAARSRREGLGYENDRTLRLYDSLARVIERLADDLDAFPEEGGWDEYLAHTLRLLDGWIDRGRLTGERLERVLGPLAAHAPKPSREQFLARTRELLETQVYREGSLADGRVLVSSIAAARGLSFRMVVVPGLVERVFPAPPRPDPLLLDDEREALDASLRTTRDAVEAERLLFRGAVRAAEERLVLSYPRFDTASGRERVPSSFLLEAVEAAAGRRVSAHDLARLARPGATGLGRPHPEMPNEALDLLERDLALVAAGEKGTARHLLDEAPSVRRVLLLDRAAWDARLTAWDGLVESAEDDPAHQRLLLAGRHSSASSVEDFAACPYRHLLKKGFGLRRWEDPERTYQLEGKDWGQLYHRAVSDLFTWMREQGWFPLQAERIPDVEARLLDILDEEGKRLVAEGRIVNEALLAPSKNAVRSEILELLDREIRDGSAFLPTDFERGYDDLEIEIGPGQSVTFHGFLDRIDVDPAARAVRVVDYKTGKFPWKRDEQFRGGRELQLALYNRAAGALYPDHTISEAIYYYSVARARFQQKTCPATAEVGETLLRVLRTLDDTARQGVFAPVADTCDYCDFEGICGTQREARAARKKDDPRLQEFLKLREIP